MEFHLVPKYRSLHVVEALKIKEVRYSLKHGMQVATLVFEDANFAPIEIPHDGLSRNRFEPGEYWTRQGDHVSSLPASFIEGGNYAPAHVLSAELLKKMRAVVAQDLISDEEISNLNQMVMSELIDENQGVIGGSDVIRRQHPVRLAEAVIELVLNKLKALA